MRRNRSAVSGSSWPNIDGFPWEPPATQPTDKMMEKLEVLRQVNALLLQADPSMLLYGADITALSELRTLQPGDLLSPAHEGQRESACIIKGVLRAYHIGENKTETTVQLLAEGGVIPRTNGYEEILASHLYKYQALTPVLLAVWGQDALDHFAQTLPNWFQFSMKMSQYILLKAATERDEMFSDDATTRYQKFWERHPTIVDRVQLRHVASYLGIAPQSLSRIRQQLSKQPK